MAPSKNKKKRLRPPAPLISLVPALSALCRLFESVDTPWMLIGGVAVSFQGRVRATEDVDATILLDERTLDRFLESARIEGFEPRITDAVAFARRSAVLLLEHASTRIGIDVTLGRLPFEREAIGRARSIVAGGLKLNIASPEDVIVMKAVAHRPKDLEDIRGIAEAQPKLDIPYIRKHVQEFAQALDMPQLWEDISQLIGKRKGPVGRKPRKKRGR